MLLIGRWKAHNVYLSSDSNPLQVIKIPTEYNSDSHKVVTRSLHFFRENFPEYIPPTEIIQDSKYPYIVRQQFISWLTIEEELRDKWNLTEPVIQQLLWFTEKSIAILESTGIRFDLIWTPQFNRDTQRTWSGCSNFMIDTTGKLFFVDNIARISLWIPPMLNILCNHALPWRRRRRRQILDLLTSMPTPPQYSSRSSLPIPLADS